MSAEVLDLIGFGDARIQTTADARKERDHLLTVSAKLTNVATPEQAQTAADALRSLRDFTKLIENSRVTVKAPVLELTKKIDGLAKELTAELDAEVTRIGRIIGEWQAAERRKVEEAERKAREEEQRIWRKAQEKERIEQQRIAKEEKERAEKAAAEVRALEEKAARARSEAGRAKASEEAEDRRIQAQIEQDTRREQEEQERSKRAQQASVDVAQTRISALNVVAAKPSGVATRPEIEFEVDDIAALYAAAPYLIKMEVNTSALKAALKGLQPGKTLAGVRHWTTHKTHVR